MRPDDEQLADELTRVFLEDARAQLAVLADEARPREARLVAADALKGAAGLVGLGKVRDAAGEAFDDLVARRATASAAITRLVTLIDALAAPGGGAGPDGFDAAEAEFLRRFFRAEANEHLDGLTATLLELERRGTGPGSRALIDELLRKTHTIKGSAAMVGLGQVAEAAHVVEEAFAKLRAGTGAGESVDALVAAVDELRGVIAAADPPRRRRGARGRSQGAPGRHPRRRDRHQRPPRRGWREATRAPPRRRPAGGPRRRRAPRSDGRRRRRAGLRSHAHRAPRARGPRGGPRSQQGARRAAPGLAPAARAARQPPRRAQPGRPGDRHGRQATRRPRGRLRRAPRRDQPRRHGAPGRRRGPPAHDDGHPRRPDPRAHDLLARLVSTPGAPAPRRRAPGRQARPAQGQRRGHRARPRARREDHRSADPAPAQRGRARDRIAGSAERARQAGARRDHPLGAPPGGVSLPRRLRRRRGDRSGAHPRLAHRHRRDEPRARPRRPRRPHRRRDLRSRRLDARQHRRAGRPRRRARRGPRQCGPPGRRDLGDLAARRRHALQPPLAAHHRGRAGVPLQGERPDLRHPAGPCRRHDGRGRPPARASTACRSSRSIVCSPPRASKPSPPRSARSRRPRS